MRCTVLPYGGGAPARPRPPPRWRTWRRRPRSPRAPCGGCAASRRPRAAAEHGRRSAADDRRAPVVSGQLGRRLGLDRVERLRRRGLGLFDGRFVVWGLVGHQASSSSSSSRWSVVQIPAWLPPPRRPPRSGLLLPLGILRGELRPGRLVLRCGRGHVGAFGLEDLPVPQHGQHPGDVASDLPDAGRVVELARGELEAQVEQLPAALTQAGGQLVAVEDGEIVRRLAIRSPLPACRGCQAAPRSGP